MDDAGLLQIFLALIKNGEQFTQNEILPEGYIRKYIEEDPKNFLQEVESSRIEKLIKTLETFFTIEQANGSKNR